MRAPLSVAILVAVAGSLACSRRSPAAAGAGAEAEAASVAPAASPPGTLTAEQRQRLLDAMTALIRAHYVFPDKGIAAADALQAHQAHGDYAAITMEDDFAQRLTDDLRALTHDRHFRVRHRQAGAPAPVSSERQAELEVEARHGIHSVERLAGGVVLLKVDSFLEPPDNPGLRKAYADTMTPIADAPALVLDLRDNYGGDPTTVAFFLSYFFDAQPVHVNDIWSRDENHLWQNWTSRDVPGKRFGARKPMFVLVSKETISGGEEAAYDLQTQKRALVLGETTAGAANPAPPFELEGGFRIHIPTARAINPITHTNWEGTGVLPDVRVDPADAVKAALSRAADAGTAEHRRAD